MKEELQHLIALTKEKKYVEIKDYLMSLETNFQKGIVFEEYIRELYEGNGWIAIRKGGKNDLGADILLYHPNTPHDVSIIVQAKNHKKALGYDDTKIEINKFDEQASKKYNCLHFTMISLNGYVQATSKLKEYANLETFNYVKELINEYDPKNKKQKTTEN